MATSDGFGAKVLLLLGILGVSAGAAMMLQQQYSTELPDDLAARLIEKPIDDDRWKVYDEVHAQSGATIPPSTHVAFTLPTDMEPLPRTVLFGQKDKTIRYWGYCFGDNFSEEAVAAKLDRGQLPGRLFMSQAEQDARRKAYEATKPRFSALRPPISEDEYEQAFAEDPSPIRNQLNIFQPGSLCYVMSEKPLAFAVDSDNDLLNNKLEREIGTKIGSPDTDEDGVTDGVEYLNGMLPKVRDSDGDGLIDGVEDKNWNGITETGETSPVTRDSDKDGLCDGSCRMKFAGKKAIFLGEDMDLNGELDDGETDPSKWSTRGDGISDLQAYFNCQLGQRQYCN